MIAQINPFDKKEKLQQLKSRSDVKVTQIQKDLLKIEYPNGKLQYKNIADYEHRETSIQHPVYSQLTIAQ